jgi:hypothetical protein
MAEKVFRSMIEFSREYYPGDILDRLAKTVCHDYEDRKKTLINKFENNPKEGTITFISPIVGFTSDPYGTVAEFYREEGYSVGDNAKDSYFTAKKGGEVYLVSVSTGLVPELLPGIPIHGAPEHFRVSVFDVSSVYSALDKALE